MTDERTGELAPGYEKVEVFGHLLTIGGRQVYHHQQRAEYSIDDRTNLVPLNDRERIIVEHALQWAKEES